MSNFTLGSAGLPVNSVSILFLVFLWIFAFFPAEPRPTTANVNWTALGYGSTIVASVALYYFYGQYTFKDHVVETSGP